MALRHGGRRPPREGPAQFPGQSPARPSPSTGRAAAWRCGRGGPGATPPLELVLDRSGAAGADYCVCLDRRDLRPRPLRLGFRDFELTGPDRPVVSQGPQGLYAFSPLDPPAAVPAGPDVFRVAAFPSSGTRPRRRPTRPRRRRRAGRPAGQSSRRPGRGRHGRPGGRPLRSDRRGRHLGRVVRAVGGRLARLIKALRRHARQPRPGRSASPPPHVGGREAAGPFAAAPWRPRPLLEIGTMASSRSAFDAWRGAVMDHLRRFCRTVLRLVDELCDAICQAGGRTVGRPCGTASGTSRRRGPRPGQPGPPRPVWPPRARGGRAGRARPGSRPPSPGWGSPPRARSGGRPRRAERGAAGTSKSADPGADRRLLRAAAAAAFAGLVRPGRPGPAAATAQRMILAGLAAAVAAALDPLGRP